MDKIYLNMVMLRWKLGGKMNKDNKMTKTLTVNGNQVIFEKAELCFEEGTYRDLFLKIRNGGKTLRETIDKKEYRCLYERGSFQVKS